MERGDIVKQFLSNGYQIAADALEYFEQNPDKIEIFLSAAAGRTGKVTVTKKAVEEMLKGSAKFRLVNDFLPTRRQSTVQEISDQLSTRYQRTSELISKRIEPSSLISINRISPQNRRFTLIAMIREVNPGDRSLVVEDQTGTTSVYLADEAEGDFSYLVEDEVVGLVCDNEDSSENRVVKVVFPDIPLPTKVSASTHDTFIMFLSDVSMDDPSFMKHSLEKLVDYVKKNKQETTVFILGVVSSDPEKLREFTRIFPENFTLVFLGKADAQDKQQNIPDPSLVDMGGVKIFLSHGEMFTKYFESFKTSPENMLVNLLKKRHLSPTLETNPQLNADGLYLEDVPDIFVIGKFQDPRIINYKGVTVISLGSFTKNPVFWSVNLKTRESIKIDLT